LGEKFPHFSQHKTFLNKFLIEKNALVHRFEEFFLKKIKIVAE